MNVADDIEDTVNYLLSQYEGLELRDKIVDLVLDYYFRGLHDGSDNERAA